MLAMGTADEEGRILESDGLAGWLALFSDCLIEKEGKKEGLLCLRFLCDGTGMMAGWKRVNWMDGWLAGWRARGLEGWLDGGVVVVG